MDTEREVHKQIEAIVSESLLPQEYDRVHYKVQIHTT